MRSLKGRIDGYQGLSLISGLRFCAPRQSLQNPLSISGVGGSVEQHDQSDIDQAISTIAKNMTPDGRIPLLQIEFELI